MAEKIIHIKLDPTEYQKAIDGVIETKTKINDLRAANKELNKDYKSNAATIEQNNALIKNLNQSYNEQIKILQNEAKEVKGVEGAYQKLNLEYQIAAKEAKDLAAAVAMGDKSLAGAASKATEKANALNEKLKGVDSSVGQNNRRVGDYAGELGKLPGAFGRVAGGAENMGATFTALKANPLFAIISVAVTIFNALANSINGGTESGNKLKQVLAPLTTLFNGLMKVVADVAGWFINGAAAIGKFVGKALDFIPAINRMNEASAETIRLEKERQRIAEEERQDIVSDSKDRLRVAELKKELARKDKYTAEDRIKMAREVDRIEKANMKDDLDRQIRRHNNLVKQMKVEGKQYKDLTTEQKDAYQNSLAEINNLQAEYLEKTKKVGAQESAAVQEIESEKNAAREKANANLTKMREAREKAEKEAEEKRLADLRNFISNQTGIINEQLEKYKEALDTKDKTLLDKVTESGVAVLNASIAINEKEVQNAKETAEKIAEIEQQKKQYKIDMAYEGINTLNNISGAVTAFAERELSTWAKVNKGKAGFDEEYARKKAKIERQAAIRAKATGVMSATVSTASAIIGALSAPPVGLGPVLGIPFATMAGISGLAQIGTILATPLPEEGTATGSNVSMPTSKTTTNEKFHTGTYQPATKAQEQEITRTLLTTERILSPQQTGLFDNIVNNVQSLGGADSIVGGVGMNGISQYEVMRSAFASALSEMKAPELNYTQWKKFEAKQVQFEQNRTL